MENNNKKEVYIKFNKKVVSISFLALALFMLLAVSYAYFTATVVGNDQAESITVEAARMSLELSGPTEVKLENALPGTEVEAKFTVTNTGTVQTTYNLDMIDVENTFNPQSDLVYSVTSTHDGGYAQNVVVPGENQTLIRNILIQPGESNKQEYTLTVRFRETGVDQNSNQGKKFTGRIQINKLEDNSLATAIVKNNSLQTVQPNLREDYPKSQTPEDNSLSGLYATTDDDGTSYYFRGAVENNNVQFAQKNWKILRINGDGSIRLILNDEASKPANSPFNTSSATSGELKYLGYTYDNAHDCTQAEPCISDYDGTNANFKYNYKSDETSDSTIKGTLENWYKENLATYDSQIALTKYCNDTSIIKGDSFGPRLRTNNVEMGEVALSATLKCSNPTNYDSSQTHNYGGVYKLKIGLITVDELAMSGIFDYTNGKFLHDLIKHSATMSPYSSYSIFFIQNTYGDNYHVSHDAPYTSYFAVVPVINLKPDIVATLKTTGEPGTESNPYVIQ